MRCQWRCILALKRLAATAMMPRSRGSCSAMNAAACSISAKADASNGSTKPADKPTATQFRSQKDVR